MLAYHFSTLILDQSSFQAWSVFPHGRDARDAALLPPNLCPSSQTAMRQSFVSGSGVGFVSHPTAPPQTRDLPSKSLVLNPACAILGMRKKNSNFKKFAVCAGDCVCVCVSKQLIFNQMMILSIFIIFVGRMFLTR